MRYLLVIILAFVLAACASIQRPQGGPRDEKPPVFVGSNPAQQALNVQKQKLELYFDENVQLQDAFNKVIVSPVQLTSPRVSAGGRKVTVELKDSLIPNTTYTIDFGDAIKDLNEGNILDGFTASFSTGDSIDTLRISGMVLEARTLEPAQAMLVGLYSNLADSAIMTLPLERVSRTNQLGQFTIHNLKPGSYRLFALNDINRDYKWDRTEDVAFYDVEVSPYVVPIQVTDTLRAFDGGDSLVVRGGVSYLPNDVLLTWFNQDYKAQYLKDYARAERRKITLNMGAPADSLPEITIAAGPMAGLPSRDWSLLHANPTLDSLQYWITDTAVLATDSLYLSVRYQRTDTNDMLAWRTDTLKFFFRDAPVKKKKKKDEEADTLPPPIQFLNFRPITAGTHEVYMPLVFAADQPIDTIYPEMLHLQMQVDTIWEDVPEFTMELDSLQPLLQRRVFVDWKDDQKYRFVVDSAAVWGVYGQWNNTVKHEFKVKSYEEYANLTFAIAGLDSLPAVAELLDGSDKVMAIAPVENGKAIFQYIKPGVVYARLYIDANANGKWDTGNLAEWIQPEEVYYFPKKLNLRRNWDVTQDWNIYETAVDMQKPYEIKKNKPQLKKGERRPQEEEEEEEDDMWGGSNNQWDGNQMGSQRGNTRGMNNRQGRY